MSRVVASDADCEFIPSDLSSIPPPALVEFATIFRDIDFRGRGWVRPADVHTAFRYNDVGVDAADATLCVRAMSALSGGDGERISLAAFARCLHALSVQHREVLPPSVYAVFPDSTFQGEKGSSWLQFRRSVWLLLEEPSSSTAARATAIVITAAIFVSTLSFCAETLPGLHRRYGPLFSTIEAVCVAAFTVEFSARLLCTPDLGAFVRAALNWIDFIAVVPFFVDLLLRGAGVSDDADTLSSAFIRAMRLVRVFRLLKTGRYLAWMRVFGSTMRESLSPLFMLLVVSSLALVFVSSFEYFLERGTWVPTAGLNTTATPVGRGDEGSGGNALAPELAGRGVGAWVADNGAVSQFTSIPDTFWWGTITLTMVGYGDVSPITQLGQFFAAGAFFVGIILTSIPISLISGNFHVAFERMERLAAIKAVHAAQKAASKSEDSSAVEESGVLGASAHAAGGVDGGGSGDVETAGHIDRITAVRQSIDATWSEPFLRSTLVVTRNSRNSLMSRIKAVELSSRERISSDLTDFVEGVGSDSTTKVVGLASDAGFS